MKIEEYSYNIGNNNVFFKRKKSLLTVGIVKSNINELLIFSSEGNEESEKQNYLVEDSDFEDEFLDLKYALKAKNPDYIIDSLINIEFQFEKFLQNNSDFEIFCNIMMNFFKNEGGDELFLKNRTFQNNSIANYFYIRSCNIVDVIRYYQGNNLPLQSKYILYERLIKDNNYKNYTDTLISLRNDLDIKLRQIDFLYSSFNRSISERLRILNSTYSDRVKEIINNSKILKEENKKLKFVEISSSTQISGNDLQEIFSYKSKYGFLEKTLNILSNGDFELLKSSYKDKIKRFYYNSSKFKYNYLFFLYFDKFLRNLLENNNLSNEDKILIEKEYLFWNTHYKLKMEENFSKKELEDVILKSYDYLKIFLKFI